MMKESNGLIISVSICVIKVAKTSGVEVMLNLFSIGDYRKQASRGSGVENV